MLDLNCRGSGPIYEQVRDGLRHLVVTGAIAQGEKLPSVRALAASLAINPNTIQRAYSALEGEGYIYTEPGVGAFAGGAGHSEARKEELFRRLESAARELHFLGLTAEELARRVTEALAENKKGGGPA